jgi:hypothetical protein
MNYFRFSAGNRGEDSAPADEIDDDKDD